MVGEEQPGALAVDGAGDQIEQFAALPVQAEDILDSFLSLS